MFEVRIHGRGGQGVVTAAELVSVAAFHDGRFAQAFPSFGSERTGAPIMAFCRISEAEIRTHEPVVAPHALVVQDPTLLHQAGLFSGLRPGGYVLVNSRGGVAELLAEQTHPDDDTYALTSAHLVSVPATDIAMEHIGKPLRTSALARARQREREGRTTTSARAVGSASRSARPARSAWCRRPNPLRDHAVLHGAQDSRVTTDLC
ncbi:MAG TPA: 2-oxoacid:acceptor oxidoreductase family protein, partial [Actinomycetales bacterium]|nr:2-oxoacid:acceptor oxidoreductase family protein [Actinomycetales bacterium]